MTKRFGELSEKVRIALKDVRIPGDERTCMICHNGDGIVSSSDGTRQACPVHGKSATVTDINDYKSQRPKSA